MKRASGPLTSSFGLSTLHPHCLDAKHPQPNLQRRFRKGSAEAYNFHTTACERIMKYHKIIQKTPEDSWLWSWPHRKTSAPHPRSRGNSLSRAKLEAAKSVPGGCAGDHWCMARKPGISPSLGFPWISQLKACFR